jgi:hypothetical protein
LEDEIIYKGDGGGLLLTDLSNEEMTQLSDREVTIVSRLLSIG